MATPQMKVRPRRFASPAGQFANAKVEPIHQPLYSAHYFQDGQAVPNEASFFGYAVGGNVAGDQSRTATLLETNMQQAGALPTPKLFLVEGIRIIPSQGKATGKRDSSPDYLKDVIDDTNLLSKGTASASAASPDVDNLEDLVRLIYGSYFKFFVGTKDYLQIPTFGVPGNCGIEGEIATALTGGATSTVFGKQVAAVHSVGKYFSLPEYRILIPSQQNFAASLNFPQETTPTINGGRLVYCFLDGILGREVS